LESFVTAFFNLWILGKGTKKGKKERGKTGEKNRKKKGEEKIKNGRGV